MAGHLSLAFSLLNQPGTLHAHYHHSATRYVLSPTPEPIASAAAAIAKVCTSSRSPSSGHLHGFRWALRFCTDVMLLVEAHADLEDPATGFLDEVAALP